MTEAFVNLDEKTREIESLKKTMDDMKDNDFGKNLSDAAEVMHQR